MYHSVIYYAETLLSIKERQSYELATNVIDGRLKYSTKCKAKAGF